MGVRQALSHQRQALLRLFVLRGDLLPRLIDAANVVGRKQLPHQALNGACMRVHFRRCPGDRSHDGHLLGGFVHVRVRHLYRQLQRVDRLQHARSQGLDERI